MDADILCLQEVQDLNHKRTHSSLTQHGPSQTTALQGEDYPYLAYGANAIYGHGHHGNAILSKFPIHAWRNWDVSDHRFEQRGMLHAHIEHPRYQTLHIICAHFGLFNISRLRQTQALIHHVQRHVPSDAKLIIAGDFNDWNHKVHQLIQRELNLDDVMQAHTQHTQAHPQHTQKLARTFPSAVPWFELDRMYTRGFNVTSAQVPQGRAWRQRSDHAPIIAQLQPIPTQTTP